MPGAAGRVFSIRLACLQLVAACKATMGHGENVRRANLLQIVVSSLARCCAALGDVEKFRPPNLLQAVITSDMASERGDWKQSREPLGSCWLSFFSSHRVQIRVFLQWRQARVFFGQFEFTRRFFSTAPAPSAARNITACNPAGRVFSAKLFHRSSFFG